MKKEIKNKVCCIPFPKTIVTVRDKDGNDNALVVGFIANVSLDPAMVMIAITPERYSHHMLKENGSFVIHFADKKFMKEYGYLGSASGRDEDKLASIKHENAQYVNACVLTDCPVSIECTVVESTKPGTHELFIGKVEVIHCDEEYVDRTGNIAWDKIDLIQ